MNTKWRFIESSKKLNFEKIRKAPRLNFYSSALASALALSSASPAMTLTF